MYIVYKLIAQIYTNYDLKVTDKQFESKFYRKLTNQLPIRQVVNLALNE